jgi:hypothetical protein
MGKSIIIFIALLCLGNTFTFAQKVKVKVKNEIIEINGNEVGKIIELEKDKLIYSVQDLSNNEILKVAVNRAPFASQQFVNNWMTISSPKYKQVNVVDYDMISLQFSPPNDFVVSENLAKKYGIFTENGINQDGLAEFFSKKRTSESMEDRTGYGGVEMNGYGEGFTGKIKEKDGILLFDKTQVCKISEKDSLITYTSLDGSKIVSVIVHDYSVHLENSNADFNWLEVSDNQGRSVEIKKEGMSNFGGSSKQVNALLSEKYNILTENGISNLDDFFAIKRKKLSEEYNIVQEGYLKSEALKKATLDARGHLYKINDKAEILASDTNENLGRIIVPKDLVMTKESTTRVQVGERNDKKILELSPINSDTFLADFYDGEKLYFRTDNANFNFSKSREIFISEVLDFIIVQKKDSILELGYEKFKEIKKKQAIEAYKKRKAISPNIYGQSGYIIDEDGEKWEGKISISFEELINPEKDDSDSVIFKNVQEIGPGSSKYGKELQLEYVNEKGKTKKDIFKSSNGIEFHVTDSNGKDEVYRGIKTNVDELEAALMATSLNFNYSSFYLIEKEDNDILMYKNPLTLAKGIKAKSNDRGLTFFSDSSEKNYLKLKKYLSDCTSLPENFIDLDYTKQESITTILNYYNSSCK